MRSRSRVLLIVLLLVAMGASALLLVSKLRHGAGSGSERFALVYDVPSDIDEAPTSTATFSLAALRPARPSLLDVTRGLRRAADDANVRALVLHVGDVGWGWGRVAELRDAIAGFRAAGKPVYVSLEGGTDQSYLLASRATRVAMPPTATLWLDGLTASAMFLKGTYDKLGVTPNFAHVGQFKSAVEQYTRTDLSPPARAALQALLDDEFALLTDSLAAARGTTGEHMRALVDDGPFTATAARAAGLVDTLLDTVSLDSLAVDAAGDDVGVRSFTRYLDGNPEDSDLSDHIALIPAVGTIVSGRSRDNGWAGADLGSETLIEALRDARLRHSVRAVVLRIDSPGGSGQASDDVWQEIARVRRVKPVIVSMSNLAASGGYYIACGADAIVADPGTFTGSIGVFGGKLNVLGLYRKLGLNIETVSRGKHAEMMSQFRDFSPEEAARFQAQLDDFYRTFVSRVSAGRGITPAQVDSLAQGRVWSGLAARRFGLVDSLGGLQVALAIAQRKAHAGAQETLPVVLYPRAHRSAFRRFLAELDDDNSTQLAALPPAVPPVVAAWLRAARFPAGAVLAMLPCSIEIR